MRILIAEDEEHIRSTLAINLELEGYEVELAENGVIALQMVENQHFDLVLLDIMMPELDGISLLKKIRLQHKYIPVIILSAKDTSQDRILGLKFGADDYLIKPFNLEELMLRIENILKRSAIQNNKQLESYSFGNNQINFKTYEAIGQNGNYRLTQKEMMLLKMLIEHKNEVVSRQQILHAVWGYDIFPSTRTIDNFILSFRKYFEVDPKQPIHFLSIRGIGYKFIDA